MIRAVTEETWQAIRGVEHRVTHWDRDSDGVTVKTACGRWFPVDHKDAVVPTARRCEGCK